jgi:hypothetical protein
VKTADNLDNQDLVVVAVGLVDHPVAVGLAEAVAEAELVEQMAAVIRVQKATRVMQGKEASKVLWVLWVHRVQRVTPQKKASTKFVTTTGKVVIRH